VETSISNLPYTCVRWVECDPKAEEEITCPTRCKLANDRDENLVVLFPSKWELDYFQEKNPQIVLKELG
jgi:peptide chain release factor 3